MFISTLNLLVETTENPFIAPATMKFIQPFLQIIGYQGVVDKRLEEDYHSIKDDIPLMSVYTTENVTVKGMLILDAFITDEIRSTTEYKDYENVFVCALMSPTLTTDIASKKKIKKVAEETTAEASENIAKVQEKLEEEEEIEKMVEGEDDEESHAMPESYKKHPQNVDDDDETEKEKKDDKKDDKKANDDEKKDETSSMETRKEKIQTPIPSLTRSPRKNLSLDKTLSHELTTAVSLSTATTSKVKSKSKAKSKARSTSIKPKILPGSLERVYDFQLGIESYQIRVNLTAPTLTFSGIEAHDPYSIVDKPNTCLIYLNSKEERRVMYLIEIVKSCDGTLKRVLKEVKLKIFKSEPWKKPPLLGELNLDILKAFEREKQASKAPCTDEKVGIVHEWKTNSIRNEATLIINP
ncbi:hypothetical protein Tco_0757980 [Tanacetum coccineum]